MTQVTHYSSENIYLKCGKGSKLKYTMKTIIEILYIANYTECYISNYDKFKNKQIDNYCFANGNIIYSVKLYNTMINFTRENRGIMTLEKEELLELKEIHGQRIVDFYNNKCKNKCSQTLAKNIFKSNKAYNDNNNEEEEVKEVEKVEENEEAEITPKKKVKDGWLYFAENEDCVNDKIGEAEVLSKRLYQAQRGNGKQDAYEKAVDPELWNYRFAVWCKNVKKAEDTLLDILALLGFHKRGECFNFTGLDDVDDTKRKNIGVYKEYKGDKYERIKQLFLLVVAPLNGRKKASIVEGEELKNLIEEGK